MTNNWRCAECKKTRKDGDLVTSEPIDQNWYGWSCGCHNCGSFKAEKVKIDWKKMKKENPPDMEAVAKSVINQYGDVIKKLSND